MLYPSVHIMAVNSTRQHEIPTCNLAALNTSKFHLQHILKMVELKRVHLTILNSVRTVLAHSGLGAQFWAEAVHCIYSPCGPQHCQMTVGKTKKADLIICNHLAVMSIVVVPASLHLLQRRFSYGIHRRHSQLSHVWNQQQ